MANPSFD
jgi:hypothetical protein